MKKGLLPLLALSVVLAGCSGGSEPASDTPPPPPEGANQAAGAPVEGVEKTGRTFGGGGGAPRSERGSNLRSSGG